MALGLQLLNLVTVHVAVEGVVVMKLMLMLIPTCALFLVSANAGAVENRSLHRGKPEAQECSLRKAKRLLEEQSAQSEKGKRSGTEVKAS